MTQDELTDDTIAEYFGAGLTSVTSGLDGENPCLGLASAWNAASGPNSQRSYRFRYNSWDNQGAVSRDWDTAFTISHGPRQWQHNGMTRMLSHRFSPTSPDGQGDTSMGSYTQGTTRFPTSGAVHAFVTCGRTQTWGTAKTCRFRIYYAVTGADQDWTP